MGVKEIGVCTGCPNFMADILSETEKMKVLFQTYCKKVAYNIKLKNTVMNIVSINHLYVMKLGLGLIWILMVYLKYTKV